MRSILSVLLAGILLMTGLSACGSSRSGRVEEARVTPVPPAAATVRPTPTARPETAGEALGDAAENAGDAVGGAVENAGDAAGDMITGAGEAMNDMIDGDDGDGRVTDGDGRIGDETGADANRAD